MRPGTGVTKTSVFEVGGGKERRRRIIKKRASCTTPPAKQNEKLLLFRNDIPRVVEKKEPRSLKISSNAGITRLKITSVTTVKEEYLAPVMKLGRFRRETG